MLIRTSINHHRSPVSASSLNKYLISWNLEPSIRFETHPGRRGRSIALLTLVTGLSSGDDLHQVELFRSDASPYINLFLLYTVLYTASHASLIRTECEIRHTSENRELRGAFLRISLFFPALFLFSVDKRT